MTLAWYDPTNHHVSTDKHDPMFTPLGQLWPLAVKREWVGLTPEEILNLFDRNNVYGSKWIEFARAVEAQLKERNT